MVQLRDMVRYVIRIMVITCEGSLCCAKSRKLPSSVLKDACRLEVLSEDCPAGLSEGPLQWRKRP